MNDRCPNCGNPDISERIVSEVIPYGSGKDAAQIPVELPIRHCNTCAEEWEDADSFRVKHDAVCKHLGRLTSREVLEIRTAIGSRERFSELTGIGPASLARWESGSLIQNAAYDLLVRAVADVSIRDKLFSLRTATEVTLQARAGTPPAPTVAGEISTIAVTKVIPFRGRVLSSAEAEEKRAAGQHFSISACRPSRDTAERARA